MVSLNKKTATILSAQKVINLKIDALRLLRKSIDKNFDKAVNAIISCQSKIILCGVGKSGLIAAKIASTMSSVGSPAFSLSANDCLHGDLGSISKKDLLNKVWSYGEGIDTHTVETHVYALRKKIETKLKMKDLIMFEEKKGYYLNKSIL